VRDSPEEARRINEEIARAQDDVSAAPTFTPFTVRPDIANRDEVARSLVREYPPLLRDAGIGGTAHVWFFIDETGTVARVLVNETSGHPELDEAALRVARVIQFTPALNRDRPVAVWISLPITFQTREAPDPVEVEAPLPLLASLAFDDDQGNELPPPPEPRDARGDPAQGPVFTPFTVRPDITNRDEVARSLNSEYPSILRNAGIGGTAQVWFYIDEDGRVQRTLINETSGRDSLDRAALRVARIIEFSPAMNRDRAVPVWISLPITWQAK
jgi:TonB family protein